MKHPVWLFGIVVITLLADQFISQTVMFGNANLSHLSNRSLTGAFGSSKVHLLDKRRLTDVPLRGVASERQLTDNRKLTHRQNKKHNAHTNLNSNINRLLSDSKSFGIFGPNFMRDFQKQFSAFSDMTFKDPLKSRQQTRKERKQHKRIFSLLPNSDYHPKTPITKPATIIKNNNLQAEFRTMFESKDPPTTAESDGLVGFKKVSKPTFSLKEEFGSKFEEMFELGFGDSVFDMYLDDLGENDVKLIDYDTTSGKKRLRKFDSIISDFGGIVNQ